MDSHELLEVLKNMKDGPVHKALIEHNQRVLQGYAAVALSRCSNQDDTYPCEFAKGQVDGLNFDTLTSLIQFLEQQAEPKTTEKKEQANP